MEKAEGQGYLTSEDVMEAFAEEDGPEQIDEMLVMLRNAGIEVYDDKGETGEEGQFDELDEEDEEPFDLNSVSSDDTVGLYLKEMARVPLLSTEEEINLARRLEAGSAATTQMSCGDTLDVERLQSLTRTIEDGKDARDHL